MKKVLMAFSFILAIAGALVTNATAKSPLVTGFYAANPSNIQATCIDVQCDQNIGSTCVVPTGYATYKSTGSQPKCAQAATLYRHP